jgi:hypothetical protein
LKDLKGRKNKKRKTKGLGLIPKKPLRSYYYPEQRMVRYAEPSGLDNFKTAVVYSVLGLGTATGLFFLGRHFYNKTKKNIAEKSSLQEGDPSTYATQLSLAFQNDNWLGWGTNTDVLFQVLDEIPSKAMYSQVQKRYLDLYGKNLNADMESELSSDEYNKAISIISNKSTR